MHFPEKTFYCKQQRQQQPTPTSKTLCAY